MKTSRIALAAACLAIALDPIGLLAQPQPRAAAPQSSVYGDWINPRHSVTVEIAPCGTLLCGAVVAASSEAQQDAREGGTAQLIGTRLLRDYHHTAAGQWQGRVFVPDRGDTFYSTISQLDSSRLRISGCILGGLICKSQVWQRA